ncbi:SpoIIE family protein phosphatase [Calditrichota bacterium GD2]
MTKNDEYFFDVDFFQRCKHHQMAPGDVFFLKKRKTDDRLIAVLSDGLGSGIKANVLATLTATMASNFIYNHYDIKKTAQLIMSTLPVCKVRKISYSTMSIVDIQSNGKVKIVEYDNPEFLLFKNDRPVNVKKEKEEINVNNEKKLFYFCEFNFEPGDRIIIYSDGVVQSGIGKPAYPLGWGEDSAQEYIRSILQATPNISSRELARQVVFKAVQNDDNIPRDDITCAVVYFRKPRRLLLISGPPFDKTKDSYIAEQIKNYPGKKIICGGTTANIIARELKREITVNLNNMDYSLPPPSTMEGVDLVTEGIMTLAKVAELLEKNVIFEVRGATTNPALEIIDLLLQSDIIQFIVGTRINEFHQNPNMPVELGIRRNVIKKIAKLLEEKYFKKTKIDFV